MLKKFILLFIILLLILLLIGLIFILSLNTSYLDIINNELSSKNTSFYSYEILAIIKIESNFNKNAVSSKGAVGLMQIMPNTATFIIQNLLLDSKNMASYNLYNEKTNIKLAVEYLHYLESKFTDKQYILAGYNAGPKVSKQWESGNINYQDFPYPETKNYVKRFYIYSKLYMYKLNILSTFGLTKI